MKDRGSIERCHVLVAAKTCMFQQGNERWILMYLVQVDNQAQVIVYGVPSMRILKYIGVFTPEPWQGYGFDNESKKILIVEKNKKRLMGDITIQTLVKKMVICRRLSIL